MKGKVLIGACTVGMLLSLGLLIGANPSPRPATQWQYGVFSTGSDGFRWNHEGQLVWGDTAPAFIQQMGLPRDFPADTGKNFLQIAFLDHLGHQGWELIQVVHHDDAPGFSGSYHYAYWLKRPK